MTKANAESKDNRKQKKEAEEDFRTSIGGQALIEGIMMRGPKKSAVVVRTKDGLVEKVADRQLLKEKYPILGWLFIRGVVNFGSMMTLGVRSLMFSADHVPEEEIEDPSKFDMWIEEKLGSEKAEKVIITIAVVMGISFSVGLFILLPTLLAGLVSGLGGWAENLVIRNIIEGVIRITIFLTYLWLTSKMKSIKRVWAYHGAEHKAIHCFEKELPLTIENVKVQSPLHPRCGTSFLFIVMIISILVFSAVSMSSLLDHILIRFLMRLALLPIIVAISYEIIKVAGRFDNPLTAVISAPGKALQRFTTNEPDEQMIEVAIKALEYVIPQEKGDAKW